MNKMVDAEEYKTKSNTLNVKTIETDEIFRNTLVIVGATSEEMRDGKKKLAIAFEGIEKILILNQTNLKVMVDKYGKETNDWRGKQVKLSLIPSSFNGQPTKSILVVV